MNRQTARFVDLGILHEIAQNGLQIADIFCWRRIFSCSNQNGIIVSGQVQKERLDTIGPSIPDGIGVYGDKQICIFRVCDGGSFFQRQVSITISGHDDLTTQFLANFFCKPPGKFQNNVFFMNSP